MLIETPLDIVSLSLHFDIGFKINQFLLTSKSFLKKRSEKRFSQNVFKTFFKNRFSLIRLVLFVSPLYLTRNHVSIQARDGIADISVSYGSSCIG